MAKIKEVTVGLGMSFNAKMNDKEVWLKPQVGFRIDIEDEKEARDPEVRKEILKRAFEIAEEALDEELQRLLSDNESDGE
jgi:hypothetical protein